MRISLKVIPKSSRNLVIEEADRLKVYVSVAPEKGKANEAVLALVAEHFGVKKQRVRLLKGERSALKVVEVEK